MGPCGNNGASIRPPAHGVSAWPARVRDDRVDGPMQVLDVSAQPPLDHRIGDLVGVQPQRCDGRPQPVGEVGGTLALQPQQLLDPVGQLVKRLPQFDDLCGASCRGPSIEISGPQAVSDVRHRDDRGADPITLPTRDEHAHQHEQEPHPGEDRPRPIDPAADLGQVGHGVDDRHAVTDRHRDKHVEPVGHSCRHRAVLDQGLGPQPLVLGEPRVLGARRCLRADQRLTRGQHDGGPCAAADQGGSQHGWQRGGVINAGHDHRDALRVAAGFRHRAVFGHRAHEQRQRDDERGHDTGDQSRRQPGDPRPQEHQATGPAGPALGSTSRTPTPRTLCR